MQKFLFILFFSACACCSRAQFWTNYIDSVPNIGAPDFYCAVEDTNTNTLYLGGYFSSVNQYTTHAIIKFDGVNFDTLQSGIEDRYPGTYSCKITNMVMYKNKLFVFGDFEKAGNRYTKNMAVWNGNSWDSVITTGAGAPDFAYILNDELYVWGLDSINGMKITGLARFDGTTWYDVPTPHTPGHTASYIVNFQGKLYKSGQVTSSSSDANLSYSDGSDWIPWVGILGDNNKAVFGMKVIDTLLFVYGRFYSIAGTQCAGLAAYNGKNWYGFGQGLSTNYGWETVENIQKINGELYINGLFHKIEGIGNSNFPVLQSTNLAKFDGQKWCIISPPVNNDVLGVVPYKNELYMYGGFDKIGNDTVRGFGKYNGGYNELCSPNVTIVMSVTGLNEIINIENLRIYPNPAKDKLAIEFTDFETSNCSLELISPLGQVLYLKKDPELKEELDLKSFPAGIYYLKVQSHSNQKVFKIIKE